MVTGISIWMLIMTEEKRNSKKQGQSEGSPLARKKVLTK